jgi:hypothetical protein
MRKTKWKMNSAWLGMLGCSLHAAMEWDGRKNSEREASLETMTVFMVGQGLGAQWVVSVKHVLIG